MTASLFVFCSVNFHMAAAQEASSIPLQLQLNVKRTIIVKQSGSTYTVLTCRKYVPETDRKDAPGAKCKYAPETEGK